MPLIEVTDEQLAFLKKAQKTLLTQDNMATANVIFVAREDEDQLRPMSFGGSLFLYNAEVRDRTQTLEEVCQEFYHVMVDDEAENQEEQAYLKKIWIFHFLEKPIKKPGPKAKARFVDRLATAFRREFIDSDEPLDSVFNHMTSFANMEDQAPTSFGAWRFFWIEKTPEVKTHGLFTFFEPDVKDHRTMDKHNHRPGWHSYGASIQRTPMMLDLQAFLRVGNFSSVMRPVKPSTVRVKKFYRANNHSFWHHTNSFTGWSLCNRARVSFSTGTQHQNEIPEGASVCVLCKKLSEQERFYYDA